MADLRGWDAAEAALTRHVADAARRGASAELEAVVIAARRDWPRDTGRSAAQLVVVQTSTGGTTRLTGYAPYVRRSGSDREAWRELIADRLDPERAAGRIAAEVSGG